MDKDCSEILSRLREKPIENAWVIQDLTLWPDRSRFFYRETSQGLSYLLITGHPAHDGQTTLILNDEGGSFEELASNMPPAPFLILETNADILPKLRPYIADSHVYFEQRMDVTKKKFRALPNTQARRLSEDDALALAQFQGAPPYAADRFKNWIREAVIMAVFADNQIVALGSTVVRIPEVWVLAGIETLPPYRGRGFAQAVTSALAEAAFEHVENVSLTVVKNNISALAVYSKLGFEPKEDRIWVDNGIGSSP